MTILSSIWNLNPDHANDQLNELITKGYLLKTKSSNVYIKILSCFTGVNLDRIQIFTDFERIILSNELLIKNLERFENNTDHDELLRKAIYQLGTENIMSKIKDIRSSFTSVEVKSVEEMKGVEVKGVEEVKSEKEVIEYKSMLENTYESSLKDTCPFNPHDDNSFFFDDPVSGERKLLEPHHIFHYKGHCFDIDTVYRYVLNGGVINLDEEYIKRFLNKSGAIDFSNCNLGEKELRNKTYHFDVKVLKINNNHITSLIGSHFPTSLTTLIANNNPIGDNYYIKDEIPNLLILDLSNCGFKSFDCDRIPNTVIVLNLSNNPNLRSIRNKSRLIHLRQLNICNTNIGSFDLSQLYSIRTGENKDKLVIIHSEDQKFKKTGPSWVEFRTA